MEPRERNTWIGVWLACHAVGVMLFMTGLYTTATIGIPVGLVITAISMVVITVLLDPRADEKEVGRLQQKYTNDDASIPNELTQASRNADTTSMQDALRTNNPARLAYALEGALALINTLKSLAKVVWR